MQSACALLYCHPWSPPLYISFPQYFRNGKNLFKKVIKQEILFLFCLQILSETLLILKIIQPDITINVHMSSYQVPATLFRF